MNQIGNPAGLRFLESMVRLIENKGEVSKVIDSINKVRDEANKRIAIVGKVEDIDRMNSAASATLDKANIALADAKAESGRILRKIKARDSKESGAQQARAAELSVSEADIKKREASVDAREKQLQKHMDETKALHVEATKLKVRADVLTHKAEEQLAIFKNVASSLN